MRYAMAAILAAVLILPNTVAHTGEMPELVIMWAAKRHWPEPYRSNPDLLVEQCRAESNLKADAESPVGAIGLCQVMPATALELLAKRDARGKARGLLRGQIRGKLRDGKTNAELAARYMARMFRIWAYPRTHWCRWRLAVASYNAGAGNVIKAQTLSGGRSCFEDIAPFLHQITGKHSAETIAYTFRVEDNVRRRRSQELIQ